LTQTGGHKKQRLKEQDETTHKSTIDEIQPHGGGQHKRRKAQHLRGRSSKDNQCKGRTGLGQASGKKTLARPEALAVSSRGQAKKNSQVVTGQHLERGGRWGAQTRERSTKGNGKGSKKDNTADSRRCVGKVEAIENHRKQHLLLA